VPSGPRQSRIAAGRAHAQHPAARPGTPLPAAAVSAIADAIAPRYEVTVWLAAGAGLREGEALGLTVPRAEFLARRLVIIEQMQNRQLSPLKTKASARVIPVDDLVLNAITAHMQRWAPGPHQLLVTNRLGQPVQRNSFGDGHLREPVPGRQRARPRRARRDVRPCWRAPDVRPAAIMNAQPQASG